MMGIFAARAAAKAQRQQAEAYRKIARAAMLAQDDACARAELARDYGYNFPSSEPPMQKVGGVWMIEVDGGPCVPTVNRKGMA